MCASRPPLRVAPTTAVVAEHLTTAFFLAYDTCSMLVSSSQRRCATPPLQRLSCPCGSPGQHPPPSTQCGSRQSGSAESLGLVVVARRAGTTSCHADTTRCNVRTAVHRCTTGTPHIVPTSTCLSPPSRQTSPATVLVPARLETPSFQTPHWLHPYVYLLPRPRSPLPAPTPVSASYACFGCSVMPLENTVCGDAAWKCQDVGGLLLPCLCVSLPLPRTAPQLLFCSRDLPQSCSPHNTDTTDLEVPLAAPLPDGHHHNCRASAHHLHCAPAPEIQFFPMSSVRRTAQTRT